jgi:hypothetical protein
LTKDGWGARSQAPARNGSWTDLREDLWLPWLVTAR